MYRLVIRLNEDDTYFIMLLPHQERELKQHEHLVLVEKSHKDFIKKMRDAIKNLIRLEGEAENYKK